MVKQHALRTEVTAAKSTRTGISLFEVVLALAIFFGAFAAISEILQNGNRATIRAQLVSEATFRCENQMNALLSGTVPLSSSEASPFDDDPAWTWEVLIGDSPVINLLQVVVTVNHIRGDGTPNAEVSMTRLIRDPQVYYDAALTTGDL